MLIWGNREAENFSPTLWTGIAVAPQAKQIRWHDHGCGIGWRALAAPIIPGRASRADDGGRRLASQVRSGRETTPPSGGSPNGQPEPMDQTFGGVSCASIAISKTSTAFSVSRKRRKSYPSETHVKRGRRIVHGDVELCEKLGRNDLCPCGSGRRFQGQLHEVRWS